jgi:hypothetical protein
MEKTERLIPTEVRLNCPDFVQGSCGDVVLRKTINVPNALIGNDVNREIRLVGAEGRNDEFAAGIATGEFPHYVVQSTSGITEAVSDDGTQARIALIGDFGARGEISSTIILNDNHARVGLNVLSDCDLESVKVFLCPVDLEPCSI